MSDINDRLELIGFDDDVTVTAQAIYDLTSRELHLYQYGILCKRKSDKFPTLDQIAKDLWRDDESWSEPTVKRTMNGLIAKGYAKRQRVMKQSSVTTFFKTPHSQITHDPTVRSPMIRQDNNNHGESRPSIARVFLDNLHPSISPFDEEYLRDLEEVYGYEVVVAKIKEASNTKGADKKLVGVKYIGKMCANNGKGKPSAIPANYREGWKE